MTRYLFVFTRCRCCLAVPMVALCTGVVVQELLTSGHHERRSNGCSVIVGQMFSLSSWLLMLFGPLLVTTAAAVSDLHLIVLQGLRYLVLQPVLLMLLDCRTRGGSFRFCAPLDEERGCSFDFLSVSQLFVSDMSRADDTTTPETCFQA